MNHNKHVQLSSVNFKVAQDICSGISICKCTFLVQENNMKCDRRFRKENVKWLYCGHDEGSHEKQLYFLVNGHKHPHPFLQGKEKLVEIAAIKETLKENLGTKFVK